MSKKETTRVRRTFTPQFKQDAVALVQRGGECREPIASALALADAELMALPVEVLQPYAQAFDQPEPSTVEHRDDEPVLTLHGFEYGPNLIPGQHHR